ncbi:transposase [Streptomyces sp. NPDC088354]|uniref:transposase n=1 Tax=Streptomyces sp. NPDC088354 TaxID=3365856 RepID=UPI00380759D6
MTPWPRASVGSTATNSACSLWTRGSGCPKTVSSGSCWRSWTTLDLTRIESRYALGGTGRRAYDPRMMLALLIYAYADGVRSSRQIERLCRTDVAMRVICGLQVPDHTVIARFRQLHQDSVRDLFTQVLLVCAKPGWDGWAR